MALSIMLLFKVAPRGSNVGKIPAAILLGVGAAGMEGQPFADRLDRAGPLRTMLESEIEGLTDDEETVEALMEIVNATFGR